MDPETKIPPELLAEGERQLREAEERIRRRREQEDEEIRIEAGQQIFECYFAQRRYVEAALKLAEQQLSGQHFPNRNDYYNARERLYVQQAAMAFCTVTDPYGGRLADTVDNLAQRCLKAEEGGKKLKEENATLREELDRMKAYFAKGGPGRGNG